MLSEIGEAGSRIFSYTGGLVCLILGSRQKESEEEGDKEAVKNT